jgi:hypothetical protein
VFDDRSRGRVFADDADRWFWKRRGKYSVACRLEGQRGNRYVAA